MCDLCGAACTGDLAHVLLACPCAELAAVRGPWLADVESTLRDAALGGWWTGLPATVVDDGHGATALGRLVEAPPDVARLLRTELTRVFLRHFGAWWARTGDGVVARLAVHWGVNMAGGARAKEGGRARDSRVIHAASEKGVVAVRNTAGFVCS